MVRALAAYLFDVDEFWTCDGRLATVIETLTPHSPARLAKVRRLMTDEVDFSGDLVERFGR